MKKLQVPYNLDLQIIDVYREYCDYISEIYFAAPISIFPTARQFEIDEEQYIKDCCLLCDRAYSINIESMLLLNGTNVVLDIDCFSRLYKIIALLKSFHLSGVVIANPILGEWVHETFPELKIRLSVLSNIYSLEKIKQIESLGYIQEICLPQDLNRNEDELQKLRKHTKLKLSSIVNSACRINCPLYYWHHNAFNSNSPWSDYNFKLLKQSCYNQTKRFVDNQFAAPWILPSELYLYDEYYQGFKLEDRTAPTETLTKFIKYYSLRINPEKFEDFLHGSCMYSIGRFDIEKLPKEWLNYTKNCKGECWHCNKCQTILDYYLKEE